MVAWPSALSGGEGNRGGHSVTTRPPYGVAIFLSFLGAAACPSRPCPSMTWGLGRYAVGMTEKATPKHHAKMDRTPTASRELADGTLVELLYDPVRHATALAVWRDGQWTIEAEVQSVGERLVPFSPENNIIKNGVVLLPSEPTECGTKDDLISEICAFLHRYLDVSPAFEMVAAYYILFTWVYDAFNEVPYIRFQGDYGTGKTRALLIVGSLCYKAFFASGASTVSPLFHILDAFRGTLVLDEADFRFSDEKVQIVKLLNNGNVDGLPVLRTMLNRQREFNPQAFRVFGPKIVATRKGYEDQALESRFLTEVMGHTRLRASIPINMPASWKDQARTLRNKLLMFRFRYRHEIKIDDTARVSALAPRGNQILVPLLSIVEDDAARKALVEFATAAQEGTEAERGMSSEAQVLEIVRELIGEAHKHAVPIIEIAQRFSTRFGGEYERPVTPRWIGTVLRQRLHLTPYKSNGRFVLPVGDGTRLQTLYERYGLTAPEQDILSGQ
jgi:hypothetical protein